jgi:hypothetical protein
MAESYVEQGQAASRFRLWLLGIGIAVTLFVGLGLVMASLVAGPALPWMGAGLAVGLGLALVVGASKTSSA